MRKKRRIEFWSDLRIIIRGFMQLLALEKTIEMVLLLVGWRPNEIEYFQKTLISGTFCTKERGCCCCSSLRCTQWMPSNKDSFISVGWRFATSNMMTPCHTHQGSQSQVSCTRSWIWDKANKIYLTFITLGFANQTYYNFLPL